MIALKIVGITLAVVAVLIAILLLLRVKLVLRHTAGEKMEFRVKILCFSFGGKKKEGKKPKKPSKLNLKLKKKFGMDILETELKQGDISDKVSQIAALVMMFAGQIKWLFLKLRIDLLKADIVCSGDDAADTAIDYGIVCAAVYPMVGFLSANLNMKKDAEQVGIYCDFEGEPKIDFQLIISIRTAHLLTAVIHAMGDMAELAEMTEKAEVINNEQ